MGHPYLINILNNNQTGRTVQQTVFLSKTFLKMKSSQFTQFSILLEHYRFAQTGTVAEQLKCFWVWSHGPRSHRQWAGQSSPPG